MARVPTVDEISRAIRKLEEEFLCHSAAGEPERLVEAFYTEDAQVLPPHRPTVCGRFEIAAFWRGVFAAGNQRLRLETTQVVSSGDLACATGAYTTVNETGKYLVVYRLQPDGSWKAAAHMFSSNG